MSDVNTKDEPATSEIVAASGTKSENTGSQSFFEPPFFDFDYETAPVSTKKEISEVKATEAPAAVKQAGAMKAAPMTSVVEKSTAAKQPAASGPGSNKPKWTLVLGAFADYRRAVELALKVKPDPGLLTTLLVDGQIHYRVSTPPLKRDQTKEREMNIASLKLDNVKLMPVCPPWQQNDDCVALDRTLAIQQANLP